MNLYENRCTEAAFRQSLSDADFWQHVFFGDDGPDDPLDDPDLYTTPLDALCFTINPCPLCGIAGPCAYDVDGNPLFHAQPEDDEERLDRLTSAAR